MRAWNAAGTRLRRNVDIDVRWTRSCYCGQEVEPGKRVDDTPYWGLSFFGGSEDGASIFHEPLSTEGRRLPEDASDPVQGRKIIVSRGLVHEQVPEIQVVRVGNRLLLGAPGEPTVEMGRRFEAAVRPELPKGVKEPVVVGLANDYMGYETTPEEYQMQHYEGGHTVFGLWSSLLIRNSLVALSHSMATGEPAPAPDRPAVLGGTNPGAFPASDGDGSVTEEPADTVGRFDTVSIGWSGSPMGVDRPVDEPFVTLERQVGGQWVASDSDLGLAFVWREESGDYRARYEVSQFEPPGPHRLRIHSATYDLESRPFTVRRSRGLKLRGVLTRKHGRRLVLVAQNPAPDPERTILWRPTNPQGGRAVLRVRKQRLVARWRRRRQAWVAKTPRRVRKHVRVKVVRARDKYGNRIAGAVRVRAGKLAPLTWPRNIGTGDGRTPGALGIGYFPP
jgi:neutral ceramidase